MTTLWNQWIQPQRQWEEQQADSIAMNVAFDHLIPQPRMLLTHTDFPMICDSDDHTAAVPIMLGGGSSSGGISIRSRQWMIRAIEACPHTQYSGIPDLEGLGCQAIPGRTTDAIISNELYFGTLFHGMRAPLPNAHEAALFSSELWPEDVWEQQGAATDASNDNDAATAPRINYQNRMVTVPIAFHHKPSSAAAAAARVLLLLSDELQDACPMLRYIL
jgi:hypothetical protein